MREGEVSLGGAVGDGDFLRERLGELRVPGLHGVSAVRKSSLDAVGPVSGGNGAVDALMNVNPGFHPPMYVALETVDAGHRECFDIRVALRGLGEIGEVVAAVAGAGLMTGDADVVEGEIAVVKANGLSGLHGKRVRNKLAVGLIDQRRGGGHVGGTRAAFDGDHDIGEAAISSDFPSRVDDFAVTGAKWIATDIDDLAQRSGLDACEGDFAFDARLFSDFDRSSQRSLGKLRTVVGDFAATGVREAQNDSEGGQ